MPNIKPVTVYRFWKKIVKTAQPGSCWSWIGATARGYGKFKIDNVVYQAHVISWLIHVGAIPKGLNVLHNCPRGDNPLCCNPEHLWLGTAKDNANDMVQKGRWGGGRKRGKFTPREIQEIRSRVAAKIVPRKKLMVEYGLSDLALWRIATRKTYANV